MRTIIIENDIASINDLEKNLDNIGLTKIVGKYTSAIEAENEILKLRPDLIILEIDLKQIDGLTLAKNIEKEMNDIKVIFITSDSEYALEAFELNQADFILKPFDQERVKKSLNKLTTNTLKLNNDVTHLVCCFKNLHSVELYENYQFKQIDLKWRTKYAKEIFTYFITHKNINIRKDVLIDTFWPEADLKEGYNNLYTNIHFIRTTLKIAKLPIIISNNDDYYNVELNDIKLDYEVWLEKIKEYKRTSLSQLEKTMNFYKGHFLQEENYLWADYEKEKYRIIWLETMEYMIEEYIEEENINKAILHALYFQKLEPYLEKTYYILMNLFARIRDLGSVERQYKRLEKMLKEEYNTKPGKKLSYFLE